MAAGPLARLVVASAGCAAITAAVAGAAGSVLLGAVGPLAAAVGTWIAVRRAHREAPARVSGLMVKLFGAKMVFFGAYVAAAVLLAGVEPVPFAASFTAQYVLLHVMEAWYLRRLFAGDGAPGR